MRTFVSNLLAVSKTSVNSFATSFSPYFGRDTSSEDNEGEDDEDCVVVVVVVVVVSGCGDVDVDDVEESGTKALVNSSSINFAASSRNF